MPMLSSAPRVATRPRFGVKMGGFESVFGNAGKEVYEQVMLGSGLIVITKASEDLLKGYLAQNPHKAGPLRARMRELEIPEDRIKAVFENFRPSSGGLLLSDDQRKALETLGLSPTAGLTIKDVARRFRKLARECHSDAGSADDPTRLQALQEARDLLKQVLPPATRES